MVCMMVTAKLKRAQLNDILSKIKTNCVMLQAATDENRSDGMQKFFAQFKGKFLIGAVFNGHHHS
jgi:DTW domain-containing protein YfiP